MPPRIRNGLFIPRQPSSPGCQCRHATPASRYFSSTPERREDHEKKTTFRKQMFKWLTGPGAPLKNPLPGSTNYLSAYDRDGRLVRTSKGKRRKGDDGGEAGQLPEESQAENMGEGEEDDMGGDNRLPPERASDLMPFPSNRAFSSQAVLADDVKDAIFQDFNSGRFTVREASEKYQVSMERVGAIVRLKKIEEQWIKEDKPLANHYKKAVLSMLPTTGLKSRNDHESINDLSVHRSTTTQLFYPTSESRRFTRADAGEAFENGLKAAEERVPHPQMIEMAKPNAEDLPQDINERRSLLREKYREHDEKKMRSDRRDEIEKEMNTRVVHRGRWDYRVQDVKVDATTVGHSPKGVGRRYGVPPQDRKKGQIKIPRTVE